MATKTSILAALFLLCSAAALCAQQEPAAPAGPAAVLDATTEAGGSTYYLSLDQNGKPVFTQVIRWTADPNALEYELEIKDASGSQVMDERTSDAMKEVHLSPGAYSYKIITYDLLGKAEATTDWVSINIVKAEQPTIASVSPAAIYMDDLDGRVTLVGQKLLNEGKVSLKSMKNGKKREGRIVQHKGDQEIVVLFPDDAYESGDYAIYFENPGGLSSTLDNALRIRFQKPVDLVASIGYEPFAPLYDSWFVSNWSNGFYPIGADADIGLFFIKQRWGYIGLEAGAEWRRLTGGEPDATITSDFILYGADMMYEYRITRTIHAIARAGGGLAWNYHSFSYDGAAGPSTTSSDPYARFGLALQFFLPSKFYGEVGADWTNVFLMNDVMGGISPRVSVGYQFF